MVPDDSLDQRYFAAWASLKRRAHLWPYLRFIAVIFERRIRRCGYSFEVRPRSDDGKRDRVPAVPLPPRTPVPAGQCLVIAGMHRSGTSMVAQAFARAGLYLGDRLKGPTRFNPDGFFEDLDVVGLHESLLALNETAWHVPERRRPPEVPPSSRASAHHLLGEKFDGQSPWGWKDPRTTLFLDFWADTLPAAKWALVYREPAHVAWSLLVRGDLRAYSLNPVHYSLMALRLWTSYGRELVRFARRHPERALLIRIPDDVAPQRETLVNDVIIGRWGYTLRPIPFSEVFMPAMLKSAAPRWLEALSRLYLPARLVLRQLNQLREQLLRLHLGEARGSPRREATSDAGAGQSTWSASSRPGRASTRKRSSRRTSSGFPPPSGWSTAAISPCFGKTTGTSCPSWSGA